MAATWEESPYRRTWHCKLGNFVASLPLLHLLRRRYPEAQIDFWGSEATADFERALCGNGQPLDWRISWDQPHTQGLKSSSGVRQYQGRC